MYLTVGLGLAPVHSFAQTPTLLVLGDSLSAAHQMNPAQGWVQLLAQRLAQHSFPYQVVNASISGDTSYDGLNRLPASLQSQQPQIVIIELGANDGLRGLPLQEIRQNLAQMIQLAQDAGAKVLLLGMRLPPNYGPAYTRGFEDIYTSLAKQYNTGLLPFLLEGIATRRELMQTDNLHPKTEAQPMLLNNVWPQLVPLLSNKK